MYRALSLLEFVDALGIRNYNIYDDVLVGDLASALGETAGSCAIEAFYRHMKPVIEATLARGPAPGGNDFGNPPSSPGGDFELLDSAAPLGRGRCAGGPLRGMAGVLAATLLLLRSAWRL